MYNEAAKIAEAVNAMRDSLETLGRSWEFVLVNDGSVDDSLSLARQAAGDDPRIRIVTYEQNRGRGRLLLVVLGALAMATLLDFVSAKRVTGPVARMSGAAREIAAGHRDRRLKVEGSSEVRELASAVNNLADSLEAQIREVDAERRRLDHLLQGMPDGILALDERAQIATATASLQRAGAI